MFSSFHWHVVFPNPALLSNKSTRFQNIFVRKQSQLNLMAGVEAQYIHVDHLPANGVLELEKALCVDFKWLPPYKTGNGVTIPIENLPVS